MKSLKIIFFAFASLFFTSCDVVEEIHLEEDGSGKYRLYADMIPMAVDMSMEMAKVFMKMDTTKTFNEDSLRLAMENRVWRDFPEELDSTFDYAKQMPDSLLNYGDNRKYMAKTNGFMRGGREKGYMYTGLEYSFNSMNELQGFMDFATENQLNKQKQTQALSNSTPFPNVESEVDYSFKGDAFKRNVTMKIKETAESGETDKTENAVDKIFSNGMSKTIVYTPRRIKRVKGEGIILQEAKKVVFEYSLSDLYSGKISSDFEIIMEEK